MNFRNLQLSGNDYTKAEVINFSKRIIDEYKIALKEIKESLKKSYIMVLDNLDPEDYYFEMMKHNRLKKLIKSIIKSYPITEKMIVDSSTLAFTNNYYRQQFATGWIQKLKFKLIDENTVEASILGIPAKGIDKAFIPQYGLLKNVIGNDRIRMIQRVNSILTQGIIQGKNYTTLAKEIKILLERSAKNAMRIVRTEMNRNLNAGKYLNSLDLADKGVKSQRMIVSVLDMRTREQSGQVDGKKDEGQGFLYPDGQRYKIPGNSGNPKWDINDRENVVDIIPDFPLEKRSGRNPVTGKTEIMDYKMFPQWMKDNNLTRNKSGIIVSK